MKKNICKLLVLSLLTVIPLNILADCVSQYCVCDGQWHPCDFTEEQCKALCGGSSPSYSSEYRNSNINFLAVTAIVILVVICIIIFLSSGYDQTEENQMRPGVLF